MTVKNKAVAGLLRDAREKQKLSIKAVAQDICVRSTYLEAMEAGRFDELPAQTFAIGFVKAYATALHLDADEIVAAFKRETGYAQKATSTAPNLVAPSLAAAPKRQLLNWLSPMAGILGVGLCWAAFSPNISFTDTSLVASQVNAYQEEKQLSAVQATLGEMVVQTPEITVTPETLGEALPEAEQFTALETVEEAPASQQSIFASAAHADDQEVLLQGPAGKIAIVAIEDSWIKLSGHNGEEVWAGILRAGTEYRPDSRDPLELATSNAGGVKLLYAGADSIFLGERGELVSGVVLNTASTNHASYTGAAAGSR